MEQELMPVSYTHLDVYKRQTGSEDKTENNKAVEISEKDTYERAKTAFATEADSLDVYKRQYFFIALFFYFFEFLAGRVLRFQNLR